MENMEQTVKDLSAPQVRMEIKDSLEYLYDKKKQQSIWLHDMENNSYAYYSNLSYYVIDILYNDFGLDEYKETKIGKFFYDEEEAKAVWKFCSWFINIIDDIKSETNDAYLNHPEWHKVYSGAKEVFDLMDANDKKYDFNETYQKWFDEHTKPEAF